jgi:hypothetical protein
MSARRGKARKSPTVIGGRTGERIFLQSICGELIEELNIAFVETGAEVFSRARDKKNKWCFSTAAIPFSATALPYSALLAKNTVIVTGERSELSQH